MARIESARVAVIGLVDLGRALREGERKDALDDWMWRAVHLVARREDFLGNMHVELL